MDDGSNDQSITIVENYCKQDRRFQLIMRDRLPKGGSTCRNIGLKNARGEYVIFLDADDVLIGSCLANRLEHFRHYPDHHFLVFSGGTFYTRIGDSDSQWIPPHGSHLKQFLAHTLPWNISLPIWNTSFLKRLDGFDEAYPRLQDVELHSRALLQEGIKYRVIGGVPDFYYRIDEDRKLKAPYQFVEMFIRAVELYTTKIALSIASNKEAKVLLKALNGTYQSAYLTAQIQCDLGNISKDERNRLFDCIRTFHQPNGLFKFYILGLVKGLHRFKGYNRLAKKLFSGV